MPRAPLWSISCISDLEAVVGGGGADISQSCERLRVFRSLASPVSFRLELHKSFPQQREHDLNRRSLARCELSFRRPVA